MPFRRIWWPAIAEHGADFGKYPPNDGTPELLTAIAAWIARRYGVTVDPATQIMALNGTREGLFNAAIALCPETKGGKTPVVLTPNPFYQVYAVAALATGAEPVYVPATRDRVSAGLRRPSGIGPGPNGHRLSLFALEPARHGGEAGLLAAT